MANKHLQKEPHRIDNDTWWYEEIDGIYIIHWEYDDNLNRTSVHIRIPWLSIRSALKRKDRTVVPQPRTF